MGQRMSFISSMTMSLTLVMARTASNSLLLRDPYPTATRIILLQNKSQTEHDCRSHAKNHEIINVCQACLLRLQGLINPGGGLQGRFVVAHTGGSRGMRQ